MKKNRRLALLMTLAVMVIGAGILLSLANRAPPRKPGYHRADRDLTQLSVAIKAYYADFGSWPPAGATEDGPLTRALSGKNPREVVYFEFPSDAAGMALLDPWGVPYRFMIEGGTNAVFRSSGRNRLDEAGREDDIVRNWGIQQLDRMQLR